MDKVFRVEITSRAHISAELDLPAQPYKLLDTLDKLRPEEGEQPDWELTGCFVTGELARCLDPEGSLFELNALAEQLSTLSERELATVEGLAKLEGAAVIPMNQFIDLAYSTDRCHFLDGVLDDTQLGRFCAENGFIPQVDDLPDEAFELLDFAKIGRQFRLEQHGVFTNQGYVQRHDELREMHKYLDLKLKKPGYTILAETSIGCEIKFPYPPNEPMGTEVVCCVDCAAPTLIGLTGGMETVDLLARCLVRLELDGELPKYKAVLEAVQCDDMTDALLLADALDQYVFSPKLLEPEDAAIEYLQTMLEGVEVERLASYLDLRRYGDEVVEHNGGKLTCYGLVEHVDGGPVQDVVRQEGPQEMGMMG